MNGKIFKNKFISLFLSLSLSLSIYLSISLSLSLSYSTILDHPNVICLTYIDANTFYIKTFIILFVKQDCYFLGHIFGKMSLNIYRYGPYSSFENLSVQPFLKVLALLIKLITLQTNLSILV